MILTEEVFYECSNKGAINHFQCEILGIPYVINKGLILKKGWKANIIGKEFSEEEINELKKAKEKTKGFDKKEKKQKPIVIKSKPKKQLNGFVYDKSMVGKSWIERYKTFLNSKYWKEVRSMVLQRDNYTCRGCGAKDKLEVHHLTYKNHFKEHKHLDDLATMCTSCHELSHEEMNNKK